MESIPWPSPPASGARTSTTCCWTTGQIPTSRTPSGIPSSTSVSSVRVMWVTVAERSSWDLFQSMYSYAVQHWLREADPNLSNNNGFTPLTLAARLGRKTIFYEMLELSKVEYWRFYNVACSAYPMTAVDTVQNDGSFSRHLGRVDDWIQITSQLCKRWSTGRRSLTWI